MTNEREGKVEVAMGVRGQDKSFSESFIPPPNNKGHAQGDAASPAF